MEIAYNCLRAQGGIIVPVYTMEPEAVKDLSGSSITIEVKSYGLDVLLKGIVIPIPEFMLEFFIDNNTITLYRANGGEYLWEPLVAVEVPKEDLLEARGAYKFIQSNSNEGRKETIAPN